MTEQPVPLLLAILAPALEWPMVLKKVMLLLFRVRQVLVLALFLFRCCYMVIGFDHLAFLAGVIFFSISSKRSDFTSRYLRSVTA